MTEYALSPDGNDKGSGSLADPWATLARAAAASRDGSNPTVHVRDGTYVGTNVALRFPISLIADGPVTVEPLTTHAGWTQSQPGVWVAASQGLPLGQRITQATWNDGTGAAHRIPVWNPAAPLDAARAWTAAVLSPANPHTRWGLYSAVGGLLYLIPPSDWSDPSTVHITVGYQPGVWINGPDVTISGPFNLTGHSMGIRLDALAARAHLDGITTSCCGFGVGTVGAINPISYGHDHLFEHCRFLDNGSSIHDGDTAPADGQGISWNMIKTVMDLGIRNPSGVPVLVSKPLTSSETVGFWTSGGSLNTTVQDCTFDGTFDGASHYEDGRYDARADTNLTFKRCTFGNHADDALDRSRNQGGVLVEDCAFRNTGTILSPAPLWGSVTLRRCTGSLIGEQVRIPDGTGARPHGSIIKYGTSDTAAHQGAVALEDCLFWSDTTSTQGICPDGGDGVYVPQLALTRTTIRVGDVVLNWGATYPHPPNWLTLIDSTLATSGARPLKVQPSLAATPIAPVADVDARYYAPSTGEWAFEFGSQP